MGFDCSSIFDKYRSGGLVRVREHHIWKTLVIPELPNKVEYRRRPRSRANFLFHVFFHVLIFAVILSIYIPAISIARPILIRGESMSPTIQDGNLVLLAKYVFGDRPSRGDIVSFKDITGESQDNLIKRVAAVGGDVLTFNGLSISVNGSNSYENVYRINKQYNMKVPEGTVYVIGDNQDESYDSRLFGPVPVNMIKGKAIFLIWPLSIIGRSF